MTRTSRLIVVVMIVAVALRVWGIGFGLPGATARPDETQVAGPAVGYLSGDLRPPFFQWPALFQYLVAAAYAAYAVLGRPLTGLASIAAFAESRRQHLAPFLYVSRALSMLCGAATVWLVHRIGRRLFDETVGVVSALFLAVAFLHVRDSHFGVADVPMTALVVASVLLILNWQERGGASRALAAGVVAGLAGAMKYNGLGACVAFGAAWPLRLLDTRRDHPGATTRLSLELMAYGVGVLVAFFGTSPYILIDWPRFVADVREVRSTLANGPGGIVLERGWVYFARVVLPAALGWPMFVLGVAGAVGLLATAWRRAVVLLAFPVAYYAFAGHGYGVFARHMLPVVPFLCITAAWATVGLARRLASAARPAVRPWAITGCALLVAAEPAWKSVRLDRLLATTDNRVVAGRALPDFVPPGSSFYQTGETYGHVPFDIDGRALSVRRVGYNIATESFEPGAPEWVLVQRSPLRHYSAVSPGLEATLRDHYELTRRFSTGAGEGSARLYDQLDAFYLPLSGFAGLTRPGPEFELYRRTPGSAGGSAER
jgi:Dolichyl-phosphate-mannose-protein mannosyltransferase